MSLRVVLGTTLALMLICPSWTAAAEPKAKQSSVASDRDDSPSRSARKEGADEERPRRGRVQKEDTEKEPPRKGRAQKEDSEKEPARKGRAEKEASQKEEARDNATAAALWT